MWTLCDAVSLGFGSLSLTHSLSRSLARSDFFCCSDQCSCPFCIILLMEHFANTTYYHNKYHSGKQFSSGKKDFSFLRSSSLIECSVCFCVGTMHAYTGQINVILYTLPVCVVHVVLRFLYCLYFAKFRSGTFQRSFYTIH